MKKVRLVLVAVVAMLFLGIGSVNAQEKTPQTVIIQMATELNGTKVMYFLLVIEPNGNSYEIPVNEDNIKDRKLVAVNNFKVLQKEINKWKYEGFVIDGTSETNGYVNIIMSKY